MEIPLISVIITTKNEAKNIGNCLDSIKKQTYPADKIEIIVVDNFSDDATKEIAKGHTDKVFNKGPERSAQRNFGVEKSVGEYFLYLDADMVLSPNVVRECVGVVSRKPKIIGLYIPEIVTGEKFWSKVRRFERSFYNGTVVDCVRFIKRVAFLAVGRFDEALTGPEDWDLDKKIRKIGDVSLIDSRIFHNEAEFDFKKYLLKKAYYSKSFDSYIAKWGKTDVDIKKQLGFSYRFFGIFVEDGKWKKLFAHPLLAFSMYFLRFLVGVKFLVRGGTKIKDKKNILVVTPFFRPNIGGAETYVNELCECLRTKQYFVNVLTYQPINSSGLRGAKLERAENLEIRRYSWIGFDLFHKLQKSPFLVFLYITPYLFLRSFLWMIKNHQKVDLIDAQGFNAAFIAKFLKKIFRKKAVCSVMSLYSFDPQSFLAKYVAWILRDMDLVIVEKGKSKVELMSIGVPEDKFVVFNQWVDERRFAPADKASLKKELGFGDKFIVQFVGRANPEKGALTLMDAARLVNKNIFVSFITDVGPVTEELKRKCADTENAIFVGPVGYGCLHKYYQAADIFCVPSQYEEGVARVIPEAISCGTPIIASNRGSIPYVLDETVSIIVDPTARNLADAMDRLYNDREKLAQMTKNCPEFARKNFTNENLDFIVAGYSKIL